MYTIIRLKDNVVLSAYETKESVKMFLGIDNFKKPKKEVVNKKYIAYYHRIVHASKEYLIIKA